MLQEKDMPSLEEEVVDVFAWLCSLANLLKIDVATALYKKYIDIYSKCKKSPGSCLPE